MGEAAELITLEAVQKKVHCGASSKDAENKVCAINKISNSQVVYPMIDKLLSTPSSTSL